MKVRQRGPVFDAVEFVAPEAIEEVPRREGRRHAEEKAILETKHEFDGQPVLVDEDGVHVRLETLRGRIRMNAGDWKLTHPNGIVSIVPADAFARAYEPIDEKKDPGKPVAISAQPQG